MTLNKWADLRIEEDVSCTSTGKEIAMITSGSRKWWALGALTVAVLSVSLGLTVISVALPTLAGVLHASSGQLQWFVAAYTLALSAALLPGGLLGDRFGRKLVLMLALVVFGAGSVAAAYATTPEMFIAAQAVLGIGAGLVIPLVLSVLTVLFAEKERSRAVGIWAAANFLALPIGPILGGWLLTNFWWGWVFLINLPVVVIGLVAVSLLVPESRSAERQGLDLLGVVASSGGLAAMIYGLIKAGQFGWSDASALVPLLAGVALLAAFLVWESLAPQPLVDLSLFRQGAFAWGTLLAGMGIFALFGLLFTAPQYFQAVLGTDAEGSGVRLLPLVGGIVAGAVLADRLAAWAGAKLTTAFGFAVLGGGLLAGTFTDVSTGYGFAAAWTAAAGLGTGLALATAAAGAVGALSPERSGVGSAVMQAVQKVGPAFAAPILGSVLSATYRDHLPLAGLPAPAAAAMQKSVFAGLAVANQLHAAPLLAAVQTAFVDGMDAALLVSAGVAGAGILLALVFMPRQVAHREAGQVPAPPVGAMTVPAQSAP